jgi:hypothetical protein
MAKLDTVSTIKCPTRVPIVGSHDHDQEDPSEWRTLYVLGFGIAGAILATYPIARPKSDMVTPSFSDESDETTFFPQTFYY